MQDMATGSSTWRSMSARSSGVLVAAVYFLAKWAAVAHTASRFKTACTPMGVVAIRESAPAHRLTIPWNQAVHEHANTASPAPKYQ